MKILMFGRGVIATVYGWALEQAGHEVEFFVRPGRAAEYGPTVNLDIIDGRRVPWGRRHVEQWPARYREAFDTEETYDLIVLSVSHAQLAAAAEFLAPHVGTATVLVLGNVWSELDEAIAPIPTGQVVWGFPGAGGGVDHAGVVRGGLLPVVVLGREANDRYTSVRRAIVDAGIRVSEQSDIRGWLWIHFIADAGMHAQGVRLGSLSKMIGAPNAMRQALLATRELLPLLAIRGVDLRLHRTSTRLYLAPSRVVAAIMSAAISSIPLARRSLEAHDDPLAVEPRAVLRDVVAEARRQNFSAPRVESALTS